jgi:hypothetical protein
MITAPCPIVGMGDNARPHHVEIDVSQTIPKMIAAIKHGGMKSFSPECSGAMFAKVVIACKLALQLLHESAEIWKAVAHPQ